MGRNTKRERAIAAGPPVFSCLAQLLPIVAFGLVIATLPSPLLSEPEASPPEPGPPEPGQRPDTLKSAPNGYGETATTTLANSRLPTYLSPEDQALYRKIFQLEAEGRVDEADALKPQLTNKLLLGYALAMRYLNGPYRSNGVELRYWLSLYGNHAVAEKIADLAYAKGVQSLPAYSGSTKPPAIPAINDEKDSLPGNAFRGTANFNKRFRDALVKDNYNYAFSLVSTEAPSFYDETRRVHLNARVVGEIYYDGDFSAAYSLAAPIAQMYGTRAPLANLYAGLCAFRMKDYDSAQDYFRNLGNSPEANAYDRAKGFFWLGRSYGRAGKDSKAAEAFRLAARESHTLYGILAAARLGIRPDIPPGPGSLDRASLNLLTQTSSGRRAVALAEIGEVRWAELELYKRVSGEKRALFTAARDLAEARGLPEVSYRLAHYLSSWWKRKDIAGLFPVPAYRAKGGSRIDYAIIYGIMRRESEYRPHIDHQKAYGLLQVYEPTARWMEKKGWVRPFDISDLLNPPVNLAFAQRYFRYLLREVSAVRGDLLRFVVAYNAGYGKLKGWESRARHGGDALLFLEGIPYSKTRDYAQKALGYIFVYRTRLGQPLDEARDLANGKWPRYRSWD